MHPLIKRLVKRAKLAYLWVVRILLAPNHFRVPFLTKLRMNIFGGFLADQYVLYDFKRNSPSAYLSEFDWYRSRWVNEPFDMMLNNKVVCTEVLNDHTKVPAVLFIKNRGRCVIPGQKKSVRNAEFAVPLIEDVGSVFVKPIAAGKGNGVFRIDSAPDGFRIDGVPATGPEVAAFLQGQDGWFLSETIEQDAALARIFSKTTNTIRLITLRDPHTGSLKIFFAVLRIGTEKTVPVDNGSRGGLVAKIDLDTGRLSEGRQLWQLGSYATHPDSGAQIEGAIVPAWEAVKAEAIRLAALFPYLQFIAWDFLVSPEGPVVIEANTSSGVNIVQMWGPQRNGELGDFYRAHGVIK